MDASAIRPRTVGEILDAGIKVYLRNARTLIGLAAVVIVPVQLLAGVVLLSTLPAGSDVPTGFGSLRSAQAATGVSDTAARLGAQVVLLVAELIAASLITAASVKAVSDSYLDVPADATGSLRFALRRLPALILMEILLVIGLVLAFLALVIPGIWLYAAWSVAVPALLIEGVGPVRALGRSRRLVRKRWWPTAGVLLVSAIMTSVISAALQALLVTLSSLPSRPGLLAAVVVATLSGAISAIVVEPFRAAVVTILYYDLRVRREGYDIELLAEQLEIPEAIASADGSTARSPAPLEGPLGPESVGTPGGPPFWPPPPGWRPET